VPVLTPGPRVEAELVGVFRFGEGGSAGATLTAFDLETAQELLTAPGEFSGVAVGAADGVTNDELRERVAGALGTDYRVRTAQEQADELSAELSSGLQFVNIFLLVFAGVALFVGSFIILNTFSMLVAQRTKELALLRALGASRGQVTRSVLLEALVLGVVGSTIGLLGGLGIASALRALFGSFGLTLDGALVFGARTVVWAYVVGILVTLFAAYLPARRAARTAPVAAMRDDVSVAPTSLRRRTLLGAALGVLAIGGLVLGSASDDGSSGASLIGIGALLLILAAIALSPILAQPFLRTVGSVLPKVWGRTGHLARENALRNPRRTAATASALMVGLALVSGFSILGTSTNASLDKLIGDALGADFVVSSAVGQPFTPEVAAQLTDIDGVEGVMQERFGSAQLEGEPTFLTAVNPEALDESLRLEYVEGSTEALTDDAVLVDSATAEAQGWAVGSDLEVLLPTASSWRSRSAGSSSPTRRSATPSSPSRRTRRPAARRWTTTST
jgi:putative ABC transport system permease protein